MVTEEEILEFVKENPKMHVKKVAKELKIAPKRVSKVREENGFGNLRKALTKEQKIYIIRNIGKKTQKELADELGFSDTSIGRIWREAGYESKEAFSPNKEEFIQIYEESRRDSEVAEYFKTTVATIRHFAEKIGYKKKYNKYNYRLLNEEQEREIVDMYNFKTSTQLAKGFDCSRQLILKIWMDAGLKGKDKRRQYYSNFDYFETIDKPEKAYYLGWIADDGCVYDRNTELVKNG